MVATCSRSRAASFRGSAVIVFPGGFVGLLRCVSVSRPSELTALHDSRVIVATEVSAPYKGPATRNRLHQPLLDENVDAAPYGADRQAGLRGQFADRGQL